MHAVMGTSCEELGRHVKIGLSHPFTMPVRGHRFASSVVTSWGYNVGCRPCTHLRPLAQTLIASSPPSQCLERERERDLETRENYGAYRALHLLPFQTMVEQDWIPSEIMQVDLQDLMS
jgi:hypothetical protein